MKIVSWNIAGRAKPWDTLVRMAPDVALLQEAGAPPQEEAEKVEVDLAP